MSEQWRAIVAFAGDYVFEWIVQTNGDYIADLAANDNWHPAVEMNCIYATKNAECRVLL